MHKHQNATHPNNPKYAYGPYKTIRVFLSFHECILNKDPSHQTNNDSNPLIRFAIEEPINAYDNYANTHRVNQKQHPSHRPHRFARIPRIQRLFHLKQVESISTLQEIRHLTCQTPHHYATNMSSCYCDHRTPVSNPDSPIWPKKQPSSPVQPN